MYQVELSSGESYEFQKNGNTIVNDKGEELDFISTSPSTYHVIKDGQSIQVSIDQINRAEKEVRLRVNQKMVVVKINDKMDLLLKSMGLEDALIKKMNEEKAPMPGLVLDVSVKPGEAVKKGDALLVLEAMKMENVIKASGDGVVKEVKVQAQQAVDKNEVLITFE